MTKREREQLYAEVAAKHHAALDRISQRRGVERVKRLYERATVDVTSRLRQLTRQGRKNEFTATQKRLVLAHLNVGVSHMQKRLAGELGDVSQEAATDGLTLLNSSTTRLMKRFTGSDVTLPTEEASVFAGVVHGRHRSLLRMHEGSFQRHGRRNVGKVEDELAVSLLAGESQQEAIDRVQNVLEGSAYEAERIVRTESAYAFSAVAADGIKRDAQEYPELMQQWSEHATETGQPLDDRVAADSLALHQQVVAPGGSFYTPSISPTATMGGERVVPDGLAGEYVEIPPNRPNDRSVLLPWGKDWGVPGWEWQGRRVWLVKP